MSVTVPGTEAEAGIAKGPFRAPRGTAISCKGWHQDAALRILLSNLDPKVAEKPEELVVYRWDGGGSGGLDAGSKVGGEGLVVLEIPGVDGQGFAFGGAGQE